jgi:hypothetical protein
MSDNKPNLEPITIGGEFYKEARIEAINQWFEPAIKIAQETGIPQALKIADFLQSNTALGIVMPDEKTAYLFDGQPELPLDQYIYLTPVLEQDIDRLPDEDSRQPFANGRASVAARFHEGSNNIYLPNSTLSRQGKGVVLLHEAKHAINEVEKLYDRQNPDSHWIEEAEVYIFEFDVLRVLGGDAYSKLIDDEMALEPLNDEEKYKIQDEKAAELWKVMFGKDINLNEIHLWNWIAQLNARWQFLSANKPDAVKLLADYIAQKTSNK